MTILSGQHRGSNVGIWSVVKSLFVEEQSKKLTTKRTGQQGKKAVPQQGSNLAPIAAMLELSGLSYEDAVKLVDEARKASGCFVNSKLGDYKEGKGGTIIWDQPKWAEKVKKAANSGLELSRQQEDERTACQITYALDESSKVIRINYSARASAVCSINENIIQAREGNFCDHIVKEGGEDNLVPYFINTLEK